MRKILICILVFTQFFLNAQEEAHLIKDLFGLRPIRKVIVSEYPWLRSKTFNGMTLFGDTLFISKYLYAETGDLDAEAGENNMLRRKFLESRLVMVPEFMSEDKHSLIILDGDVNKNVNSGGLILQNNSTSGLLSDLNYSKTKSKLNYVELDGNFIRKVRPWEANKQVDFAYYPAIRGNFSSVVFVGNGSVKDLFIWNERGNSIEPFGFNSEANDINPYIFNDSLLFFSSDRMNPGNYDLYFYNFKQPTVEPRLLFPDNLKTEHDELAIAFLSDSVSVMAQKIEDDYVYSRVKINLGYAPNSYLPIPEDELDEPLTINDKIIREHGRQALEMFLVNYGEQLTVRKPENIFLDTVPLNPYAVRIVEGVIKKDNMIDVSFLLPFELEDTAFQSPTYSLDNTTMVGVKKIAQLLNDIDDVHVMIIGFADAPGGEDLNLMRSYFQASSMKMQLNELHGVPESKIHMITAGQYIDFVRSDLNVKNKNNLGAIYLFRNRKAPALLTAYKIQPTESMEIVAARFGITMSNITYSTLLLKPFLEVPEDLMFIPVSDITMVWKGHDMNETAEQYGKSLNTLLRINSLSEPIIEKQKIIYIP